MNSIPASRLVRSIPSVLSAGGNPFSLNGVMFTRNPSVPLGMALAQSSAADADNYFGATTIEAILAGIYFAGYSNADALPGTLYFVQYNDAAVAAYLRSGSFEGVALAQLQALAGQLIVPINGEVVTSGNINLAAANSFTNAAAIIQTALQVAGGIFAGNATIDDGAGNPGNVLTITGVTSGVLHLGDPVVGVGINPGTVVTAFGTGQGGLGSYTVSGAAQHVTPAEVVTVSSNATVAYDAQLHAFRVQSSATGANSTLAYATGTIAAGLKLQAAQGAILSQGAAATTPAGALALLNGITQNFAAFMTVWEPDTATKLAFVTALQAYEQQYAYVAWDSDASPRTGAAPASFGAQCLASAPNGIWVQYEPADDNGNGRKAAFICGTIASIDYDLPNGRIAFAYKGQAGLVPDITNETEGDNLIANGYNFYGSYASRTQQFRFTQPGRTPGVWRWFESYVNQIWFNSECQSALLNFLATVKSNPYTSEGDANLRNVLLDPITRAGIAGVWRPGVTLSNAQRVVVNMESGVNGAADSLQSIGWYLFIGDTPPEVRQDHGSPPMKLWYTDGQSMQTLNLSSVAVL